MAIIQLFYYLFFYTKLLKKTSITTTTNNYAVSVIICAKNEAENLKKYLPKILEQNYTNFEVIVVNDSSHDNTENILETLEKKYKKLRHTTIKPSKFKHGKKLALTIGIKSAKNEYLLLTDADCYPANSEWISSVVNSYTEKKEIIIGYGAYIYEKTFLNKIIRYDNFFNSINFLSFAMAKIPYMGTGRNLSYKKSLFIKNKGFASHYGILSGDDDLFVNENANKENVAVLSSPSTFTYTKSKKTFADWYYQKMRHLTASKKYKTKHKILLSIEPISRIIIYSIFILSIIFNCKIIILLLILLIIIKIIILHLILKNLQEKNLLLISLLYDVLSPLFYIIVHINKKIRKQVWN